MCVPDNELWFGLLTVMKSIFTMTHCEKLRQYIYLTVTLETLFASS